MDIGYFSAAHVSACVEHEIEPRIALGREGHHLSLDARFGPEALVEPVFGIIKHVMGFRQFSLRGLAAVTGEWTLVTLAFDLKRMNVMRFA